MMGGIVGGASDTSLRPEAHPLGKLPVPIRAECLFPERRHGAIIGAFDRRLRTPFNEDDMAAYQFDDRNTRWNTLGDFQHLAYSILNVDAERLTADVLFKFAANQQIVLHRHMALNNTFVIQGEHRLYEPDGRLKEVRPVGSYTSSPANPEPHREGGGDQDVVILFSIRGNDGVLYEVLDDDQNTIATISMQDLKALYQSQQEQARDARSAAALS
jgi:quercetin dioxygenase-like cupin family protein